MNGESESKVLPTVVSILTKSPLINVPAEGTAKLDGFERKMDQVLVLHQTRLDKHDAELDSQRQSLEDLKTEVSLLRKSSFDTGRMSCDTSSDTASTSASAIWVVPAERACERLGSFFAHRTPCRTHFLLRTVCQVVLSGSHPSLTFHALAWLKMKLCAFSNTVHTSRNKSYITPELNRTFFTLHPHSFLDFPF